MLGVFMSLDFFLFYVFWEVMLLPMYFLIGVWGGPRREYAAIKFFLYTLLGSVLMLIAILMLYFSSDLGLLTPDQLVQTHVASSLDEANRLAAQFDENNVGGETRQGPHVQHPRPPANRAIAQLALQRGSCSGDKSLQWWAFLLLFIGFAIKVPAVPVHTWLPDAHVEAPTPISMILAGVLLKMGGYGIIRICYPICPDGGYELANFVCAVGVSAWSTALRRDGSEGLQATRRLQLRQPHGLRRPRHGRLERDRRTTGTTPTTGRWA